MPEETLFTTERRRDRSDIAAILRDVADALEAGEELTLSAGDQSITLSPPTQPTFEIEVEREREGDGPGELSIEFELEWDEGASGDDGDLTIE